MFWPRTYHWAAIAKKRVWAHAIFQFKCFFSDKVKEILGPNKVPPFLGGHIYFRISDGMRLSKIDEMCLRSISDNSSDLSMELRSRMLKAFLKRGVIPFMRSLKTKDDLVAAFENNLIPEYGFAGITKKLISDKYVNFDPTDHW